MNGVKQFGGNSEMGKKTAKPEPIEKTEEEKFQSVWFAWNIVEDALLVIAGILAIVLGIVTTKEGGLTENNEIINNIILYSIATFIVLDGLLRTILLVKNYKHSDSSAYLVGGFEITIGIVLMIMGAQVFFNLIINFLGVFLLVMGVLLLFVAIAAIVKKIESRFMPVLEILFGAILVGFGIALLIIYHAGEMQLRNRVSFILIGIILATAGIAMLIGLLIGRRKKAKEDKKKTQAVVATSSSVETKSPEVEVEVITPEEVKTKPRKEEKHKETEVKAIEDKSSQGEEQE